MGIGGELVLKDCLDVFREIYEKEGEKYIIDSYALSQGSYVLIDADGYVARKLEVGKKDNDTTSEDYKYFKQLDYLSRLIDMNKPVDSKKVIHSNNYLSFYVKKDNIDNGKLKEDIIDAYYDVLKNPTIKYKKEKLEMYKQIESRYGNADEKKVELHRNWIKENIFSILDRENIKKDGNYLKIFFETDIEEYIKESEKYLLPNIYNNTDYNIEINNSIYGLPNDNMNLNAKKPFLKNRSRKNPIPYLIDTDEVLIQKRFFDYLENKLAQGKYNIYLKKGYIDDLSRDNEIEGSFTGYFMRIQKGKEVEIHQFDIITNYSRQIKDMYIDNILNINYPSNYEAMDYKYIDNKEQIKNKIDKIYFNGYLNRNFFTEASDIKLRDSKVKFNLLNYRQAFFNWFYKGNEEIVKGFFSKLSIDLINNSIGRGRTITAQEQFNLMVGVQNYFEGGNNVSDTLKELPKIARDKINNNTTQAIEGDEEYYFLAGQVISYLISLSKASKIKHSLVNSILNTKNDERLKQEIRKLFKKYNYDIGQRNKRFNNILSMVLGYIPKGDRQEDILLYGYLHSNLIYEKTDKSDSNNKGEDDKHE